jgi:hypothetical protein
MMIRILAVIHQHSQLFAGRVSFPGGPVWQAHHPRFPGNDPISRYRIIPYEESEDTLHGRKMGAPANKKGTKDGLSCLFPAFLTFTAS